MRMFILMLVAAAMTACAGGNATKEVVATTIEEGAEIVLTQPDLEAGTTVNMALKNRRSSRDFSAEPLSLEELSGVMWAAAGVNREDGHLTAPSALALYPVKVYAFLEGGVYLYDAPAHKLVRVAEGDHRALAARQAFANNAPLNIAYIADVKVYEDRPMPADVVKFLCGQDAAGYAENVNLYAAGNGLKAITRGSAQNEEVLKLLNLCPERYILVLAQTVGK